MSDPADESIEPHGDILLTRLCWDCECEAGYLHPKSEARCAACGAERDARPDSRAGEVLAQRPDLLTEEQRGVIATALRHGPRR